MSIASIRIATQRQIQMVDITRQVLEVMRVSGVADGTAFLFTAHTTCGITIQENADPGVQHDMQLVLGELVPREDSRYRHVEDNSASHVQSSMMGCSAFVFVDGGVPVLGRWQGIYLTEFDGPRERTVYVKVLADPQS